jgi:hypothetical protein
LRASHWALGFWVWGMALATAGAQTSAIVDEATLMVTGAKVGRESFRIIRAPGSGGQVFRAVATSALGDSKINTILTTDSAGGPVGYELRLSKGTEQQQFLQGRRGQDRFSVLVQTRRGEAVREFLMAGGTVLWDDELFHQFYFVLMAGLASADSSIVVISPREESQIRYHVEFKAIEVVVVGRQPLSGRRFALTDGEITRAEVWIDAAGRLLKASVPGKNLVAIRDDPPR